MKLKLTLAAVVLAVLIVAIAFGPIEFNPPAEYLTRGAPDAGAPAYPPPTVSDDERAIDELAALYNKALTDDERDEFVRCIMESSWRYGVDPFLVAAVIARESGFCHRKTDGRINESPDGCRGAMQLNPVFHRASDDLAANIEEGTAYLVAMLHQFDRLDEALAGYNAGPTVAVVALREYQETRDYVRRVIETYRGLCDGD